MLCVFRGRALRCVFFFLVGNGVELVRWVFRWKSVVEDERVIRRRRVSGSWVIALVGISELYLDVRERRSVFLKLMLF